MKPKNDINFDIDMINYVNKFFTELASTLSDQNVCFGYPSSIHIEYMMSWGVRAKWDPTCGTGDKQYLIELIFIESYDDNPEPLTCEIAQIFQEGYDEKINRWASTRIFHQRGSLSIEDVANCFVHLRKLENEIIEELQTNNHL